MSRPAIPPADRLILSLVKYGGSAPLTKIRANFYGRLTRAMLNKVLLELDDLIEVEKTRDPGSKRRTTSIVLTWRGEVAARVLKPGFRRKRITLAELKAELAARRAEQNPWACKIQKDAEHRREFDRQKAAGWTWRPPKPVKLPADPPREDVETGSGDTPTSPRPIATLSQHIPGTATRARTFADDLAAIQGSQLVGFGDPRGFDNNPKPLDRAPTGETRVEVMARAHADGCVTQHAGLMFEGEEFGRDWKRFAVASKKKGG